MTELLSDSANSTARPIAAHGIRRAPGADRAEGPQAAPEGREEPAKRATSVTRKQCFQGASIREDARRERRSERATLRRAAQKLPTPDEYAAEEGDTVEVARAIERLRKCGRCAIGAVASVTLTPDGVAGTRGVETCGRALVCAECGARIREARRGHLLDLIEAAQKQGLGVYFVTLTLRHYQGHSLAQSLGVIRNAWRMLARGRAWQDQKKGFGLSMVSAVEITTGSRGWHPHLHLVLFQGTPEVRRTDGEWVRTGVRVPRWTEEQAEDFRVWLGERWLSVVEGSGMPAADERYSMDWREAYSPGDAAGLADYLAKDQGTAEAAARLRAAALSAEVTRGDLKTKQRADHATVPVFSLLADAVEGDAAAWRKWSEYEETIRGLRWWRVSHGLAEALGLMSDNRTDEEIAAEVEARGVSVLIVPARDWWRLATAGRVPDLLTLVEVSGVEVARDWLWSVGYVSGLPQAQAPPG